MLAGKQHRILSFKRNNYTDHISSKWVHSCKSLKANIEFFPSLNTRNNLLRCTRNILSCLYQFCIFLKFITFFSWTLLLCLAKLSHWPYVCVHMKDMKVGNQHKWIWNKCNKIVCDVCSKVVAVGYAQLISQ